MDLTWNDITSNGHQTGPIKPPPTPVPQQEGESEPEECPFVTQSRPVWLKNTATQKEMFDTLHQKACTPIRCPANACIGALMAGQSVQRPPGTFRNKAEVWDQAQTFMNDYYKQLDSEGSPEHKSRLKTVHEEIKAKGIYDLTIDELRYGSRMAWRNAARCVARIHWNSLEVFDYRHVTTTPEMFEALKTHVEWGTNGGNIRVGITIFPPRQEGKQDFRVWSAQFIQYAGYKNPDGTFTGDPGKVNFTKACQNLGWKSDHTDFDVLPLVLSASGEKPQFFDLPKELIMELPLKHPKFPWFEEMGLRWYAMPAVADMLLDVGGMEFPAAPFNGWYTSPEIGSRNLCDPHRYNILEKVAKKMGLDTSNNDSLWKDRALVQINLAVLYSYQSQGISIVDHHTAADSFLTYMEQEQKLRGGTNADWVWLIPPLSGSTVPTYHQQMVNYYLKPSYEYQNKVWEEYPELLDDEDATKADEERQDATRLTHYEFKSTDTVERHD